MPFVPVWIQHIFKLKTTFIHVTHEPAVVFEDIPVVTLPETVADVVSAPESTPDVVSAPESTPDVVSAPESTPDVVTAPAEEDTA